MRTWPIAVVFAVAATGSAAAQTPSPADGPWSGQAQCVLVARAADYQEEITHTWRLTGEPAVVMGSTRHWPAVWSAAGRGTRLVRGISGSVPASDNWTITTPEVSAPIAIWQVPTSGNIRIASQHSPLVVQRAIDVTSSSGERIGYTLQEWAFPAAEDVATNATISGTRTRTVAPGPGWRQPQMVVTTETCTWNFTRGGAAQTITRGPAPGRIAVPGTTAPPATRAGVFPPGFGIPSVAAPAPSGGGAVLTNPNSPRAVPLTATADLATTIVTVPAAGGTTYYHGDNVRFAITATNAGPAEANGAVIGVPRDPTAVKVLVTCDAQNGAQCPPGLSIAQVESGIAIPTLPAGGSLTFTLFAQVRASGNNNPFTLASTVSPPSGVPDPNAANNSSRYSGPLGRRTAGSGGADVYTTIEPQPPTRTYWQPTEPARYRVIVYNSGQVTADNIEVTVPASPGLMKTSVTCTAVSGGECPANLTVAQLEGGVVVPRLAARDGHVIILFEAKVTGEPGSHVSATTIARVMGAVADNLTNDNVDTRTLQILIESTDSAPPVSPGPPGGGGRIIGSDRGRGLSNANCRLAGPALNPPAVSPAGPILTWPHINGARYTVSRSDMGVLTPTPLTAQFVPSTVTFAHSAPMYRHMTYRYTVTAEYSGGCGQSDVSITPPPPFVPVVTSSAAARGNGVYAVTLSWTVPSDVDQYLRDNVGFVVLGPGLPPTGHDDNGWDVGCGLGSTPDYCAQIRNRKIPPFQVVIQNLPAGEHTWIVTPYWETENGRMIDVSSGARITVRVP